MAYDLIVEHPHEILVKATYRLHVDKPVARLAWTILNDRYASGARQDVRGNTDRDDGKQL